MFWWSTRTANGQRVCRYALSHRRPSSLRLKESSVILVFRKLLCPTMALNMIVKNFERIARAALFGPSRPAQHMHSLMG